MQTSSSVASLPLYSVIELSVEHIELSAEHIYDEVAYSEAQRPLCTWSLPAPGTTFVWDDEVPF